MIDVDELAADLLRDEDSRQTVYDDATKLPLHPGMLIQGHPTIAVGRALDVHGLSKAEIKFLLSNDIADVSEQLFRSLPWFEKLDGVRQRALGNMTFNLGMEGLLGFHGTLGLLEAKQYEQAATAVLSSKWAKQVGQRAVRIAAMLRTGKPSAT